MTYIKCPENRTVLAAVRWKDIGRLFVNDDEFRIPGAGYGNSGHVELPLRAGWNTLMIKCANYTWGWDYRIAIENPMDDLVSSNHKE